MSAIAWIELRGGIGGSSQRFLSLFAFQAPPLPPPAPLGSASVGSASVDAAYRSFQARLRAARSLFLCRVLARSGRLKRHLRLHAAYNTLQRLSQFGFDLLGAHLAGYI